MALPEWAQPLNTTPEIASPPEWAKPLEQEPSTTPTTKGVSAAQQKAESGGKDFNSDGSWVMSPKGAMGRNQILLSTTKDPGFGVKPIDSVVLAGGNKHAIAKELERVSNDYMDAMRREFPGNEALALAAYNAGPGAVRKAGGIPNIKETKDYIAKILKEQVPSDVGQVPSWEKAKAIGLEGVRLANDVGTGTANALRLARTGYGMLGDLATGSSIDEAVAANPRVTYKGFAEPSATSQLIGGVVEKGTNALEGATGNTGWASAGVDAASNIAMLLPLRGALRPVETSARNYLSGTPDAAKLNAVIEKGIMKGVQPKLSDAKTAGQAETLVKKGRNAFIEVVLNKDNLKLTDEVGNPVEGLPTNRAQFRTAIDNTKKAVWEKVEAINTAAGEQGATVSLQAPAKELSGIASQPVYKTMSPETGAYATSVAERLRAQGTLTVAEAQEAIGMANQSMKNFYTSPSAETASRAYVDSLVANHLRAGLDAALEKATGSTAARGLRESYGSLKSIEEAVNKGAMADAKKANYGLIDFSSIYTAGELARAMATLNPAIGAKAGAMVLVKSLIKGLNDPNLHIKNAFKAAEKLVSPVETTPPMMPNVAVEPTVIPPEPGPRFQGDAWKNPTQPPGPPAMQLASAPGERYVGDAWKQEPRPPQPPQMQMPPEPLPRYEGEGWRAESATSPITFKPPEPAPRYIGESWRQPPSPPSPAQQLSILPEPRTRYHGN